MAGPKVGYKCVLKAAGVIVAKARDVEANLESEEIDVTTRSSEGWKEFLQGHKSFTLKIEQLWVIEDEAVEILLNSYLQGTVIEFEVLDEEGEGFVGDGYVSGLDNPQGLSDAVGLSATVRGTGQFAAAVPGS